MIRFKYIYSASNFRRLIFTLIWFFQFNFSIKRAPSFHLSKIMLRHTSSILNWIKFKKKEQCHKNAIFVPNSWCCLSGFSVFLLNLSVFPSYSFRNWKFDPKRCQTRYRAASSINSLIWNKQYLINLCFIILVGIKDLKTQPVLYAK